MKTPNYKLLLLNKLLRAPFVMLARLIMTGWVTIKTVGHYTAIGFNLVFNRRNAVRIRKAWRAYCELCQDAGDWMINKFFFRGKVGYVNFNLLQEESPDGYLVLRQFGDQRMVEIGYRIENRWLVTRDSLPMGYVLASIRSQAIEQGYQVAHVKWGSKLLMPYFAPRLSLLRRPDDVSIPSEELWMEVQKFPQYDGDPLGRHSAILSRY